MVQSHMCLDLGKSSQWAKGGLENKCFETEFLTLAHLLLPTEGERVSARRWRLNGARQAGSHPTQPSHH
jgi:hypothetical protein